MNVLKSSIHVQKLAIFNSSASRTFCKPLNSNTPAFLRRKLFLFGSMSALAALPALKASASEAEASEPAAEVSEALPAADNTPKRVFVAGATGGTGKRIVKELLEKGIKVTAGVRSFEKAKEVFGTSTPNLDFVLIDVTESVDKLKSAIGTGVDAVIVATGFAPSLDLTAAWRVDNWGTIALLDASLALGIPKFVLVSSLLTNGAAAGQAFNRSYIILNLFGLVLIAKLQAEKKIQQSGIDYTIVRPGGLKNEPPSGNIVAGPQDTLFEGSISRDSVAKVAVESLFYPEASYKIVEIISKENAPKKSFQELFASIP